MHGVQETQPSFDEAARVRVRGRLLHYMREHRIGVPTLAKRITDASPRKQEIPIKTLQRFLAGHMRTYDSYVSLFNRFAENLPDHDPIGTFAKAISSFYRSEEREQIAGEYRLTAECMNGGDHYEGDVRFDPDHGFCRATANLRRITRTGVCYLEGPVVFVEKIAVMMLRDKVTNTPADFFLSGSVERVSGHGNIAHFQPRAEELDKSALAQSVDLVAVRMRRV